MNVPAWWFLLLAVAVLCGKRNAERRQRERERQWERRRAEVMEACILRLHWPAHGESGSAARPLDN